MVPGGFSAQATEVEQEGLRLPPVKLFKRGVIDAEIFAIITSNIRVADQRIGDIKAQAAALKVGERRLTELIDRYTLPVMRAGDRRTRDARGALMRAHIAAIPDGVYRAEAFVDCDGVVNAAAEDRARRHQVRRRRWRSISPAPRRPAAGR